MFRLKELLQVAKDREDQKEYIMYHGTTLENAMKIKHNGFIRSTNGMLGPGVYLTRSFKKALAYPKHLKAGQKRVVLQLSVRVGKVKRIDRQGHQLQKTWHEAGYDTAWVPPKCGMVRSDLEENCIRDTKRIKVQKILEADDEYEAYSSNEDTDGNLSDEEYRDDSSNSDNESYAYSSHEGSDENSSDEEYDDSSDTNNESYAYSSHEDTDGNSSDEECDDSSDRDDESYAYSSHEDTDGNSPDEEYDDDSSDRDDESYAYSSHEDTDGNSSDEVCDDSSDSDND